jgi:hypothetical protein
MNSADALYTRGRVRLGQYRSLDLGGALLVLALVFVLAASVRLILSLDLCAVPQFHVSRVESPCGTTYGYSLSGHGI